MKFPFPGDSYVIKSVLPGDSVKDRLEERMSGKGRPVKRLFK